VTMFVANKGTEDEWTCECCEPDGSHAHSDATCEHSCCSDWDPDPIDLYDNETAPWGGLADRD